MDHDGDVWVTGNRGKYFLGIDTENALFTKIIEGLSIKNAVIGTNFMYLLAYDGRVFNIEINTDRRNVKPEFILKELAWNIYQITDTEFLDIYNNIQFPFDDHYTGIKADSLPDQPTEIKYSAMKSSRSYVGYIE